jgi:hypothetical protein
MLPLQLRASSKLGEDRGIGSAAHRLPLGTWSHLLNTFWQATLDDDLSLIEDSEWIVAGSPTPCHQGPEGAWIRTMNLAANSLNVRAAHASSERLSAGVRGSALDVFIRALRSQDRVSVSGNERLCMLATAIAVVAYGDR